MELFGPSISPPGHACSLIVHLFDLRSIPEEGEISPGDNVTAHSMYPFVHATYEVQYEFLCRALEKVFCKHVVSSDLRIKIDLTDVIFLGHEEALRSDLSDTSMLVLPPSDTIQVVHLMYHIRAACSRSSGGAILILPSTYSDRHSLHGYESLGTFLYTNYF